MRWKHPVGRCIIFLALVGTVLSLAACASSSSSTPPPANVKAVQCDASNIIWEVAPEAEIVNFACALGEHGGEPSLIFNVGVKNVSDKDLRFRINIFLLDMDKAAGHLVPRKGKPPVLKSGAEETVKIPFIKTTAVSKKIQVIVVPMSSD